MSTYEPQRELNQNLLQRIRKLETEQKELKAEIERMLNILKINAHIIERITEEN